MVQIKRSSIRTGRLAVDRILHPAELTKEASGHPSTPRAAIQCPALETPKCLEQGPQSPLDMHPSSSSFLLLRTLSMATCLSEACLCPLSSPCLCARVRGNSGKPPSRLGYGLAWCKAARIPPRSTEHLGKLPRHDQGGRQSSILHESSIIPLLARYPRIQSCCGFGNYRVSAWFYRTYSSIDEKKTKNKKTIIQMSSHRHHASTPNRPACHHHITVNQLNARLTLTRSPQHLHRFTSISIPPGQVRP